MIAGIATSNAAEIPTSKTSSIFGKNSGVTSKPTFVEATGGGDRHRQAHQVPYQVQ